MCGDSISSGGLRSLDMTLSEVKQLAELAGSGGCDVFQEQFQEVVRRKQEDVDLSLIHI